MAALIVIILIIPDPDPTFGSNFSLLIFPYETSICLCAFQTGITIILQITVTDIVE